MLSLLCKMQDMTEKAYYLSAYPLWPHFPEINQSGKAIFMCKGGVVSEPDPRKIEKEGLVNRLRWKCTLCLVCRHTSDWLLFSILMCVY